LFIDGMDSAASAAQTMVNRNEHIHFGCPLCHARFSSLEEARRHTAEEGQKILGLFEVTVE